jgi:ribosomal protein S12
MSTINQLCKNQRKRKNFKSSTPALEKNPQQKGGLFKGLH